MNRTTQRYSFLQSMEWAVAGVSLLLLIIAGGLALVAKMALRPDDFTDSLLAFYLASWSYVLGMVVLSLLSIRIVVKESLAWANRHALKEFAPAESPVTTQSHHDVKRADDMAA
jgi:hypothetical protein